MKILFLAAWYPNRTDDMEGLFVRKHAQAAALHDQVHVLFLKSEARPGPCQYEKVRSGEVVEHYFYYPKAKNALKRAKDFWSYYQKGFKTVRQEMGKPDLIHCHVMTRHALMAAWFQLRYGIPYVITEHWSRYYRRDFHNSLHRWLTRRVARKARRIMPVSESLAQAMRECGIQGRYTIVRNVVDDFFYQTPTCLSQAEGTRTEASHALKKRKLKTIVHVCCFDETAKNNFGLLRALKTLALTRSDFRILFVGDGNDWEATRDYAKLLNFKTWQVVFTGKLQPREVKDILDQSCFMVLFSNYETASVVIGEAMACGKPVVATRTGGIPEIVDESNGILVEPKDERAVWKAMDEMLDRYEEYDSKRIKEKAGIFRFAHVGSQLHRIYEESLSKQDKDLQ